MTVEENINWILSIIQENEDASVLVFSCTDCRFKSDAKGKRIIVYNNECGRISDRLVTMPKGSCQIVFHDQVGNSAAPIEISALKSGLESKTGGQDLSMFLEHHDLHQSYLKLYTKEDWKSRFRSNLFPKNGPEVVTWSGLQIYGRSFSRRYSDFGYENGVVEVSAATNCFPRKSRIFHFAFGPRGGPSLLDQFAEDVYQYFFRGSRLVDVNQLTSFDWSLNMCHSYKRQEILGKPVEIQKFLGTPIPEHEHLYPSSNMADNDPELYESVMLTIGENTLPGRHEGYIKQDSIFPVGLKWREKLTQLHRKKIWIPKISGIEGVTQAFGEISIFQMCPQGNWYARLRFFSSEKAYVLPDLPDYAAAYGVRYLTSDEIDSIILHSEIKGADLEFQGVFEIITERPTLASHDIATGSTNACGGLS